MRLLVCGSRDWADRDAMYGFLDRLAALYDIDVVIEGEARGADMMAAEWAEARGYSVLRFPADWSRHGKRAGPIRNEQMLVEGKPDLVVAFHPHIAESKGTADMVRRARKAEVDVLIESGR